MQYRMSPLRLSFLPPGRSNVEVHSRFVNILDNRIPIGEEVTLLAGFVNIGAGASALNVSGIMGSLNNPMDFSQYMMNFTFKYVNEIVEPDTEVTFSYPFKMDPDLEPVKLQMAMTIFYTAADGQEHSNTYFNQTVEFVSVASSVDTAILIRAVFGLAVLVGTLFLIYTNFADVQRRAEVESATSDLFGKKPASAGASIGLAAGDWGSSSLVRSPAPASKKGASAKKADSASDKKKA